jgi:hypothetical protein
MTVIMAITMGSTLSVYETVDRDLLAEEGAS